MALYDTMGPGGAIGASVMPSAYSGSSPLGGVSLDTSNPWSTLLTGGQQVLPGIINSNAASDAANAQVTGYNNAIGSQESTLGNINSLYAPQYATGVGANANLASVLGLNGAPPDYSLFSNSPGYQFSLDQSQQAINRAAAAGGNLYSTSTIDALSKNAAGYASQNYNNYVTQLMNAAGLGQQANSALTGANLTVGGNISNAQIGAGNANASGIYNAASANSSAINGGLNLLNGVLNSGGIGSNGNILTSVGNFAKGLFGGGNSGGGTLPQLPAGYTYGQDANGNTIVVNTGTDAAGGYYDAYGNYITPAMQAGNTSMNGNTPGDMSTGYDNSQTDYSQSSGAYSGDSGSSPYIYDPSNPG